MNTIAVSRKVSELLSEDLAYDCTPDASEDTKVDDIKKGMDGMAGFGSALSPAAVYGCSCIRSIGIRSSPLHLYTFALVPISAVLCRAFGRPWRSNPALVERWSRYHVPACPRRPAPILKFRAAAVGAVEFVGCIAAVRNTDAVENGTVEVVGLAAPAPAPEVC